MKTTISRFVLLGALLAIASFCVSNTAFAVVNGYVDNPQTNSVDWAADVVSLGSLVNSNVNFDTHPLGALQPDWYEASDGVTLTPAGSAGNITFGTGPNDGNIDGSNPGEGPHAASNYLPMASSGATLTIDFDTPTYGAGLFTVDKFLTATSPPTTIEAFTGPNGTGTSLGIFNSSTLNFQPNNLYFMGITSSDGDILSVVFTFSGAGTGDSIGVDDIVFASSDGIIPEPKAQFNVTKTFDDLNDADVEVTLTCNTGLPLQQSFTISGGDIIGVTFVVKDFEEGAMDCEVTETGSPDGYTVSYNNCSWTNVTSGLYICEVINEAKPATFIVNKVWEVNEENGGDDVIRVADITITCDAEIEGGYQDDDDRSEKELPGGIPWPGYDDWMLDGTIVGDGSLEATVDTSMGPVMCEAEESSEQSGVESTDDCGPREIGAGETSECTITNTVFFEGIPSLNQYGLAIMALLMLGMGMVGFRRFV